METQSLLESIKYYSLLSSIQGAGLIGVINLMGFVCSVENIKGAYLNKKTQEEFIYNWTVLDRAMMAISKPGRSLAYLIFNPSK